MDTWLLAMLISTVILVVVVVAVGTASRRLGRNWNKHRADTIDKWNEEGVEYTMEPVVCQFGGLDSVGEARQLRGAGYAALTTKDLRVTRVVPSESWILNYKQIKGITLARHFKGKVVNKTPFIVVKFSKEGQADKLAFQVKDVETWAKALAAATGVKITNKPGT